MSGLKSLADFLAGNSDDDDEDIGHVPSGNSGIGAVGGIPVRMPAGSPSTQGDSRGASLSRSGFPGPGRQLEKPDSMTSLGPAGSLHGRSKSPAPLEARGPGRQLEKPDSMTSLGPVGSLQGRSKSPAPLEARSKERSDPTVGLGPVGSLRGRSNSPAPLENQREGRGFEFPSGQKLEKPGAGLGLGPTDSLRNRSKSPAPPDDPFQGMASMGRGGLAGSSKHSPGGRSGSSHGRSKSPAQLERPDIGLGLGSMDRQRSRSKSPAPFDDDPLASKGMVMLGSPLSQGDQHLGRPNSLTSLGPVGSLHGQSKPRAGSSSGMGSADVGLGMGSANRLHNRSPSPLMSRSGSAAAMPNRDGSDAMTSLGPVGSLRGRSKSPAPLEKPGMLGMPGAGHGLHPPLPMDPSRSRSHSPAPPDYEEPHSLSRGGSPGPGHRLNKPDPMASLGPAGSLRGQLNAPPSLGSLTNMGETGLGSLRGLRSRSGSPMPPDDRAAAQDILAPSPSFSRGLSTGHEAGTWHTEIHSPPSRLGAPREESPSGASVSSRSKKHKKDKKDKKEKKRKKHAHVDEDEGHDLLWGGTSQHGNHLAPEEHRDLNFGSKAQEKDKSKKNKKGKKDKNDKHDLRVENGMEADLLDFSEQLFESAAKQEHASPPASQPPPQPPTPSSQRSPTPGSLAAASSGPKLVSDDHHSGMSRVARVCRFLVRFEPLSMSVCWNDGNTRRVSAPTEIKPADLANEQSLQSIANDLCTAWRLHNKNRSQLVALLHRLSARRLPIYRVIDASKSSLSEKPGGRQLQDFRLPQGALFLAVERALGEDGWWWLRLASGRCWVRNCAAASRGGAVAELCEPNLLAVERCQSQIAGEDSLSIGNLDIAVQNVRLVEKQVQRQS